MSNLLNPYRFSTAGPPDPLDALQYTALIPASGCIPGTLTQANVGALPSNLRLGMANDASGKVIFQPSSAIESHAGVWPGSVDGNECGFQVTIADFVGWTGTTTFLTFGLGFQSGAVMIYGGLEQGGSTPGQRAIAARKTDGWENPSSSGWTYENTAWGVSAINPKTVPIYLGVRYRHESPSGVVRVYRGNGLGTWTLLRTSSLTPIPASGKFGFTCAALTGTDPLEVILSDVNWNPTWP